MYIYAMNIWKLNKNIITYLNKKEKLMEIIK